MSADDQQLVEQKSGLVSAILAHVDLGALVAWIGRRILRRKSSVLDLMKALDNSKADVTIVTPEYSASKRSRRNRPAKISIKYRRPP